MQSNFKLMVSNYFVNQLTDLLHKNSPRMEIALEAIYLYVFKKLSLVSLTSTNRIGQQPKHFHHISKRQQMQVIVRWPTRKTLQRLAACG